MFCPCALVLATPTAIMAAIGNATKHGFLVREGDALERLAKVKRIAFDKTGTLTYGTPVVMAVKSFNSAVTEDELWKTAACVELLSEHPLGKAIVSGYKDKLKERVERPEEFFMLPGLGVSAKYHGKSVIAGNVRLLKQSGIALAENVCRCADGYISQGCTVVYVGINSTFVGFLALSDTLRDESEEMIRQIKDTGVCPLLLTGDNENAAKAIARQLGIDDCHAGCLPEDKLKYIEDYQGSNEPVCMIGDGINDAPALKKAMVGIAMGGIGSDIAVDAADIALVDDEVKELPHLLRLSKRMMLTIKCNLTFSMTLNFVAVVLAITGVLNPVVGALIHNAGSVFVIINSALLLKWRVTNRS